MTQADLAIVGSLVLSFGFLIGAVGMILNVALEERAEHKAFMKAHREFEIRMGWRNKE